MFDASDRLQPGVRLDRYELLGRIAEGGMATVWLARLRGKHQFEKLVAIKTIKSSLGDDASFQAMFLDEGRLAAEINHPNVVQIHDLGEADGVLYMAMEFVDGESLARLQRLLRKRRVAFDPRVVLRIIADACAGLHAAHELRDDSGALLSVVHRDVSPQNILVTAAGAVKVIDFGIAKASNRAAGETRVGLVKGKLQYMPPEQALGGAIDRRADVWALGVCLYELLAGELPFDGDTGQEIVAAASQGRYPALPPSVPRDVAAIVQRALTPAPDGRFETAAAMKRAIESALAALGPTAAEDVAAFLAAHVSDCFERRKETVARALAASVPSEPAMPQLTPLGASLGTPVVTVPTNVFARRSRTPWIVGAVVVLSLVAIVIALGARSPGSEQPARAAAPPEPIASPSISVTPSPSPREPAIVVTPSQTASAVAAPPPKPKRATPKTSKEQDFGF